MSKASAYFTLQRLDGKHDEKTLKKGLDALPGVLSVSISENAHCVAVDFDTTGVQSGHIEKQLEKLGYEVLERRLENHIM